MFLHLTMYSFCRNYKQLFYRYRKETIAQAQQTSMEISFLSSLQDSIFYSIARFFIRKQYCAATRMQWQLASRVQNRLQIIWISIEAHTTLQWIPIWCP